MNPPKKKPEAVYQDGGFQSRIRVSPLSAKKNSNGATSDLHHRMTCSVSRLTTSSDPLTGEKLLPAVPRIYKMLVAKLRT
jgi:hypothetical protein